MGECEINDNGRYRTTFMMNNILYGRVIEDVTMRKKAGEKGVNVAKVLNEIIKKHYDSQKNAGSRGWSK